MGIIVRAFRWLVSTLVIAVITVMLLELALQLAAWTITPPTRDLSLAHNNSQKTILALGDSNTYGVFVSAEQTWPAQLQKMLIAAGGSVRVVNMGWPGTNSTILNWQFSNALSQVHPDLVLIMIGVNDSWTRPLYREKISFWQRVQLYSRVYRLWQLGKINTKLLLQQHTFTDPRREKILVPPNITPGEFTKKFAGLNPLTDTTSQLQSVDTGHGQLMLGVNTIANTKPVSLKVLGYQSSLHYSIDNILKQAQTTEVPVIFVSYGADISLYHDTNHALFVAQEATSAKTIDVRLHQLLRNDCFGYQSAEYCKIWLYPDNHPTAAGYQQIAQAIATYLQNNSLIATGNTTEKAATTNRP